MPAQSLAPSQASRRSAGVEAICAQGRAWIRAFEAGDVLGLVSAYGYTSIGRDRQRYEDAGRSLLVYCRGWSRDRSRGRVGEWQVQVDIDQATPDVRFPPPTAAF